MRRFLPTVVLTAALACGAAACLPQSQPVQNGRLPDSSLANVHPLPSCRIAKDIEEPLRQMIWASILDGVIVQPETRAYFDPLPVNPPRIESCYRTYEMQVWWRSFYCFFGSCQFAAVPGTSIHGWGRAVDFEDKLGALEFDSPGYHWLKAHAAEYGFFHPAWAEPGGSSPEPWHWEHR